MKVIVRLNSVLRNVAPTFHKAIWREYEKVLRVVRNGKIYFYGTRYS